ncbi:AAA family ATPase [Candidatus Gracilibacteria bacterium]|nr:AAA family ATPase [Candidatus Gracilibacteria bacterium]
MIEQFMEITGVGRFKNCTPSGNTCFGKNTVIFGQNTTGKSTLTAIFRSLKDGNKNLVHGRKRFGYSGSPIVRVRVDTSVEKKFSESDWLYPQIELFDNIFINQNVFNGEAINREHTSNLYSFFLGEDLHRRAIDLGKEMEFKKTLDASKTQLLRLGYPKSMSDIVSFDDFLKIIPTPSIDELIAKKEGEITQQKNLHKISESLSRSPFSINFSELEEKALRSLDSKVQEGIKAHIQKNWKHPDASQDFLQTGLHQLKDGGNCVFCGQGIQDAEPSSLIKQFSDFFDGAYQTFQKEVNIIMDKFISTNVISYLSELALLGFDLESFISDKQKLLDAKSVIDGIVTSKKTTLNLSTDLNSNQDYVLVKETFTLLNEKIEEKKRELSTAGDLPTLERQKSILTIHKNRFLPEFEKLCADYTGITDAIEISTRKITTEIELLNTDTTALFEKHRIKINEFLTGMHADFSIKKMTPKEERARTNPYSCAYEFSFHDGHTVPITNITRQGDAEPEDKTCFINTLSDADRRSLAFAFFLSKLSLDDDLSTKVVVFDDPISSFDANKKEDMMKLLRDIKNNSGDKPAQIIILTHEMDVLELTRKIMPADLKGLDIQFSIADRSSVLRELDIHELCKAEIFKRLDFLEQVKSDHSKIDLALLEMRIIFERILKIKYYASLSRYPTTLDGIQSVSSFMERLEEDKIWSPQKTQKAKDLYLHEPHHDSNTEWNSKTTIEKVNRINDFQAFILEI